MHDKLISSCVQLTIFFVQKGYTFTDTSVLDAQMWIISNSYIT